MRGDRGEELAQESVAADIARLGRSVYGLDRRRADKAKRWK